MVRVELLDEGPGLEDTVPSQKGRASSKFVKYRAYTDSLDIRLLQKVSSCHCSIARVSCTLRRMVSGATGAGSNCQSARFCQGSAALPPNVQA